MKTIAIGDFLTESQIITCIALGNAKDICRDVIEPHLTEINAKLGQETDPLYLAYAVEHCLTRYARDKLKDN